METTVVVAHGMSWVWRPGTDDALAFKGHEENLYPILRALLPEGTDFVDVGAHTGLWSLRLAEFAREVHAVEANPETMQALVRNRRLNPVVAPKVILYPMAAWDSKEMLGLEDENGLASGGSTRCIESEKGHVQGAPLDVILFSKTPRRPDEGRIGLIKIDVEGAEARVLAGAAGTITANRPNLFIEMHDMWETAPENLRADVEGYLRSFDYRWTDKIRYGGSTYISARPSEVYED